MQVLADAQAVDDAAAAGKDTGPLCGLAFAVKDNIDVLGYPTAAGTPVLEGDCPHLSAPVIRLKDMLPHQQHHVFLYAMQA